MSVTTSQESGLGVFQIEVTFKAAMDGYPLGKIRQELASEEDFCVSDNFSRIWARGVSDRGAVQVKQAGHYLPLLSLSIFRACS